MKCKAEKPLQHFLMTLFVSMWQIKGEVPGLYSPEELEPLLSPLKDSASQDGFNEPLYNYFSHSQFCIWFLLLCLFVLVAGSAFVELSPFCLYCQSISSHRSSFTVSPQQLLVFKSFLSHQTMLFFFRSGIQQNLHIVLIMDCSNSNFTINCESNPAFYRKCSVQWMEGWTESSMKKVRGQRY